MKHKEFVLADIAKLENGNKLDKNKMTRKSPSINFVSRTAMNNGISDYVDKIEDLEPYPAGCITLAFGGSVGSCFLQDKPFYTGQNVGVITLSNDVTTEMKLYFITALEKKCKSYFHAFGNEINKHFKTDLTVSLPVTDNDDIDWQYMQERIVKLEQEHIAKLEQERITELDAYLKTTGLDSYELTEEDKHILNSEVVNKSAKEEARKSSAAPAEGKWQKEAREFLMEDLFKKEKLGWIADRKFNKLKDVSKEQTPEFDLPLVNAKDGNNGIMYYGRSSDFSYVDGGIDIVSNGAVSTGNVYPQPHKIGVLFDAYIVNLKNGMKNEELLCYLSAAIKKSIKPRYGYSDKAVWNKVKNRRICLPIQTDDSGKPVIDAGKTYSPNGYIPDWDYMEKYIKATEKEIIKEVVLYKDKVIEKAKEIAGEKEVA